MGRLCRCCNRCYRKNFSTDIRNLFVKLFVKLAGADPNRLDDRGMVNQKPGFCRDLIWSAKVI